MPFFTSLPNSPVPDSLSCMPRLDEVWTGHHPGLLLCSGGQAPVFPDRPASQSPLGQYNNPGHFPFISRSEMGNSSYWKDYYASIQPSGLEGGREHNQAMAEEHNTAALFVVSHNPCHEKERHRIRHGLYHVVQFRPSLATGRGNLGSNGDR